MNILTNRLNRLRIRRSGGRIPPGAPVKSNLLAKMLDSKNIVVETTLNLTLCVLRNGDEGLKKYSVTDMTTRCLSSFSKKATVIISPIKKALQILLNLYNYLVELRGLEPLTS